MKITVRVDGKEHSAKQPHPGATRIHVPELRKCPACGADADEQGLSVSGAGKRIGGHDTYEADAHALCCRKRIGTILVRVSTIFGVEEDERVQGGPWRVY
jgi:hypothetical protein